MNNDEMGMTVLLKKDEVSRIDRSTDLNFYELGFPTIPDKGFSNVISETNDVAQKIKNNVPARHYFYSVWSLEKKWKQIENLKKYIGDESDKLSNPIKVL